jgi:glycosyltransferase involved in cell wall biosynthesis
VRVGIIAYAFERPAPPSFASYTLELARAITACDGDIEITLLATSRDAVPHLPPGFRAYVLPGCKWLPGLMVLGNVAAAAAVRACRLDLVHDPTGVSPFFLRRRSGGWVAVGTVHDLVSFVYPETHTVLTNFMHRVWLPRALGRATAVVTVSQHSKKDIVRYLGLDAARIEVIPCGVGAQFSPLAEAGEGERLAARYGIRQPYILYLGAVTARKNLTGLLQAFARLRVSLPQYTMVVAGAPAWKAAPVHDTVKRLEMAPHVLLTGYVSDGDVPALYRQADLFAFPSLYEGFGRPPLEAMACGTPVVTSNSSSLPEVAADAALLVDPQDPGAIAAAMATALTDADLRRDLVHRGLARARRFTWEQAGREVAALYRRLLGKE